MWTTLGTPPRTKTEANGKKAIHRIRTPTGVGGQHTNVVDGCKLESEVPTKCQLNAGFPQTNYMGGTSNDTGVVQGGPATTVVSPRYQVVGPGC